MKTEEEKQTVEVLMILNDLQARFDTRVLAASLAARAGVLYALLIAAGLEQPERVAEIFTAVARIAQQPPAHGPPRIVQQGNPAQRH